MPSKRSKCEEVAKKHDPSIFCQCSECWKADIADEKSRRDKAAKPLQDLIAKVKRETRRDTLLEARAMWERNKKTPAVIDYWFDKTIAAELTRKEGL